MSEDSSDFMVPVQDRCFEDYEPGQVSFGGCEYVDEKEVLDFGRRFDPE